MIVRGFIMIKDNVFKQLELEHRFDNKRCGRGLSLITDRSFNDFYCGLNQKQTVQSENK